MYKFYETYRLLRIVCIISCNSPSALAFLRYSLTSVLRCRGSSCWHEIWKIRRNTQSDYPLFGIIFNKIFLVGNKYPGNSLANPKDTIWNRKIWVFQQKGCSIIHRRNPSGFSSWKRKCNLRIRKRKIKAVNMYAIF